MPKKIDFWTDHKVCPGCKRDLNFIYYNKNKSTRLGICSRCKSCESIRKKESYRRKKQECPSKVLVDLYNKIKTEAADF